MKVPLSHESLRVKLEPPANTTNSLLICDMILSYKNKNVHNDIFNELIIEIE